MKIIAEKSVLLPEVDDTDFKKQKLIVMAGHQDGIISFGKDLNEAGNILFQASIR